MLTVNLLRKRRRRPPISRIAAALSCIAVLCAIAVLSSRMRSDAASTADDVGLDVASAAPMFFFQEVAGGPGYEYTPPPGALEFPRGVVLTFTVQALTSAEPVTLQAFGLAIESFTPLDDPGKAPSYEAPRVKRDVPASDDDAIVRLDPRPGAPSRVQWVSGQPFPVPAGVLDVKPAREPRKGDPAILPLSDAPLETPLASLNRAGVRLLVIRIVLDAPGVASFRLAARCDVGGKEALVFGDERFSLVYNPACDVGSLAFHRRTFQDAPTFANAVALRDKLIEQDRPDDVIPIVTGYRNRAPGPDADWLVGAAYRALGDRAEEPAERSRLHQAALCKGLLSFYHSTKEHPGDRLARWTEAKEWMTRKVQSGELSIECP